MSALFKNNKNNIDDINKDKHFSLLQFSKLNKIGVKWKRNEFGTIGFIEFVLKLDPMKT